MDNEAFTHQHSPKQCRIKQTAVTLAVAAAHKAKGLWMVHALAHLEVRPVAGGAGPGGLCTQSEVIRAI